MNIVYQHWNYLRLNFFKQRVSKHPFNASIKNTNIILIYDIILSSIIYTVIELWSYSTSNPFMVFIRFLCVYLFIMWLRQESNPIGLRTKCVAFIDHYQAVSIIIGQLLALPETEKPSGYNPAVDEQMKFIRSLICRMNLN